MKKPLHHVAIQLLLLLLCFSTGALKGQLAGVYAVPEGFAAAAPFTFADFGNDIGGTSAATSNTIINFGGGGTNPATGINTTA